MTTAPDNLDDVRRDIDRALAIIEKRTPEYEKGRLYYEGKALEVADSTVAQAIVAQSKAAPVSFAHIPVDVIAEKVELRGIVAKEPAAAAVLETWSDVNDLDDEATDWIRKACYFGDYYAVTDPTGLNDDDTATIEDIDTIGMSPLSTVVVYDRKTGRVPLFGFHLWDSGTKENRQTRGILYYDDAEVKVVADGDGTHSEKYELDFDPSDGETGEDAWMPHAGERMLISHLAVGGRPYGTPIHRRAWGPQDAITKVSANNLVNVDATGLPSRWALLDPLAEIDDDVDDDFGTDGPNTIPGDGDSLTTATRQTRVRSIPGAIAMLRGVKQTGTYEASSADGFLKNLDWYVRAMAVACGIALFEFDMSGEQPSGESRRRAEGRANRKAASVKRQAGAFFREIADTVLGLVGTSGEVTVNFNPSETSTDKDGLELVASKVATGVPLRQALLEAGYTPEQVEEWYPKSAPAYSPTTIALLATALQAMGAAKTLGVITDTEIAAMLPEILTETRGEGGAPAPLEAADGQVETFADVEVDEGADIKAKAEALGILVRAGADPEEAAEAVGLSGISFPNVPTTVRIPEDAAAGIEDK